MNEIEKIENHISKLTINNIYSPKSMKEFEELNSFENFEDLKRQINEGLIKLVIPDNLLYSNFKETSTKKYKILSDIFLFLPYLIGIVFSVIAIKEENYILFLSIPIVIVSFYLSSIIKSILFNLFLICIGIYLMNNSNFNIGLFILIFSASIISSILFRKVRRMGFINSALASEKIFCFLFYARNISIFDCVLQFFIKSL